MFWASSDKLPYSSTQWSMSIADTPLKIPIPKPSNLLTAFSAVSKVVNLLALFGCASFHLLDMGLL